MTIELFTAALAAFVTLCIGFLVGYVCGHARGSAFGWQEGYFQRERDERNKRDHFGRFKSKNAPKHEWRVE